MRKGWIVLLLLSICSLTARAQSRKMKLTLFPEAGLVSFDGKSGSGWGLYAKASFVTGPTGALTLTTGMGRATLKKLVGSSEDYSIRSIPVLVGYEHAIGNFRVEPQLGLGELGGKYTLSGVVARPSIASLFSALAVRYEWKAVSVGLRAQYQKSIEGSEVGTWYRSRMGFYTIQVGIPLVK
ncbi:hypothetical protein KACHI17_00440 [Sediminibacterium sp. KACHI17]|uniref:Outer membrane protein beta-barrel domain-containing protein n=1 Tax=Sediminibacterium sp. KACHI17 TaxID=1751071 RepID=A0AAT9GES8_9BACT